MGIRYDKDSRKGTNGPMIFFSISRDEAFEEEIRSAFISGLSFYAYRYPHDHMMSYGSSECFIEGFGVPGFVIGMFDSSHGLITIPYKDHGKGSEEKHKGNCYNMPEESTGFKEYSHEVEEIINGIKKGEGCKTVAARVIVRDSHIDIADKFYELCEKYPDAYIFCFSTPATGCWIGASPELLLESNGEFIQSMALAGTRSVDSLVTWDDKNKEEQQIVTDYIKDVFDRNGLNPIMEKPMTKKAGSVEHICTVVKSSLSSSRREWQGEDGIKNLEQLLKDLYPTPALCGVPKEWALNEIKRLENFDRGCYGGFCGLYNTPQDFHFNVVLRCLSVNDKKECIYVGGGITANSEVSAEWKETEMKIL